jgi:hypothetical protein
LVEVIFHENDLLIDWYVHPLAEASVVDGKHKKGGTNL